MLYHLYRCSSDKVSSFKRRGCYRLLVQLTKSAICAFYFFLISGVPENHRSVFVEEDFSVVEFLAGVGQRVGLILVACESMDNRVRKTRRRRHHGRKLSQERLRPMRRLELPSPYAVWRDRLFHTTQKPHRINRGLPLNQIPIIKQR
jgi:hypothetical protein